MSTALPPEIYDIILGFLHSDKDALQACSLTCKAWLPASRYHLFDKIALAPSDVLAFLEYVDSSSSTVATIVRRLVVRRSVYSMMRALRIKHITPRVDHLKAHFRGLRSLTLSEVFWGVLPSDIRYTLSELVAVTELNLHRVNFETLHQAVQFICAFPALEHLSFKQWAMQVPDVAMDSYLVTAPKLAQKYPLRIHIDCLNLDRPKSIVHMIQWLVIQEPSPSIQLDTLRLGPLRDLSLLALPCIHKLMRMSDLPLVHLQIKAPQFPYSPRDSDNYMRHFVDVVSCKEIRSLSFDLIIMSPPPDAFTPFRVQMIPEFLTRVTWCRIQQISLAFVISQGSHVDIFDWKSVANILARSNFDDLRLIRIIIHLDHGEDDGQRKTETFIREHAFFMFNARGILDVEFRNEIEGTYY